MSKPTYHIYQITNNVNGKIYIGAHKGAVDDGYMGSGRALKAAIKKYGREAFTKTILCECESASAMYDKEREMVDDAFVARRDTYNINRGGAGGDALWTQERKDRRDNKLRAYLHTQSYKDAINAYWTPERRSANGARAAAYYTQERRDAQSVKSKAYWTDERKSALKNEWSQERKDAQSARMKSHYDKIRQMKESSSVHALP